MGDFLRPDGFVGPRGLRALAREGSAAVEVARYVRRSRAESRARSGTIRKIVSDHQLSKLKAYSAIDFES